nr:T9SS type A sorting domain-containing protein [Parabacteroides sp. 52]
MTLIVLLALQVGYTVSAQEKKTAATATPVTVKQEEPDSIEISVAENRIVVSNVPVGSTLEIYSVVGIKVKEIEMKHTSGEYVVNLAKGYYIVRVAETVRKIAIR